MARKPALLYRREIDGKVVTVTEKAGVFELQLEWKALGPEYISAHRGPGRIAVALVDPTYSNPIQHARRV